MEAIRPESKKPRICPSKLAGYRQKAREDGEFTSVADLLAETILENNPDADITCPVECPGEIIVRPKLPILRVTIPMPEIFASYVCPLEQIEET